jgi:hypothetical protein
VLNLWTVTAITLFYVSLSALVFYGSSWSQFRALWFANVANTLLWWQYLKAAVLVPLRAAFRRPTQFKTTLKVLASA